MYAAAAEAGYRPAATHLATAYSEGRLGNVVGRKAADYAALAANMGDSAAAHMLGEWYEHGTNVQQDDSQAVLWYDKAARLGNPVACLRLNMAYSLGQLGLSPDSTMADEYKRLAL
jgi:TPR repeat protein